MRVVVEPHRMNGDPPISAASQRIALTTTSAGGERRSLDPAQTRVWLVVENGAKSVELEKDIGSGTPRMASQPSERAIDNPRSGKNTNLRPQTFSVPKKQSAYGWIQVCRMRDFSAGKPPTSEIKNKFEQRQWPYLQDGGGLQG